MCNVLRMPVGAGWGQPQPACPQSGPANDNDPGGPAERAFMAAARRHGAFPFYPDYPADVVSPWRRLHLIAAAVLGAMTGWGVVIVLVV